MPLYEYRCDGCATEFELLVRGQEKPACPTCGTDHIDKLLSVSAAPVIQGGGLPMASSCPPGEAPCSPVCCRLPQ